MGAKFNTGITAEELKKMLRYDEKTGLFTWLITSGNAVVNKVAGTCGTGYRIITIKQRYWKAHRLAWLYVYGELPHGMLDHINGDKDDNRISNLRECTRAQNALNSKARTTNKLGTKGISMTKSGNFRVRIHKNGKETLIGTFDCIEKAKQEYAKAAKEVYGDFYHG